MNSLSAIVCLLAAGAAYCGFDIGRSREYCKWETFNATCRKPDHVILMNNARYGRMRFGRCMQEDHGSVGCSTDVLHVLDRKCSGRHTCQLSIPDASLHAVQMCPRELIPYLEASYDCIQVRVANRHTCAMFGGVPLRSRVGYLAAISAVDSMVGTSECPWFIDIDQGQRVNLSIHGTVWNTVGDVTSTVDCPLRLVVHDDNKTTVLLVCPDVSRVENQLQTIAVRMPTNENQNLRQRDGVVLYASEGRRVRIHVQLAPTNEGTEVNLAEYMESFGAFIIKYEVIGCSDITWLPNVLVRRDGDQTVITCNGTGETYYVTCDDNKWPLDFVNCTKPNEDRTTSRVNRSTMLPRSVLSVVAVGMLIGVCVGVAVLTVVLRCLRSTATRTRLTVEAASEENCNFHGRTKEPLLCPYINTVPVPPPPYSSFELDGVQPTSRTRPSPAGRSLVPITSNHVKSQLLDVSVYPEPSPVRPYDDDHETAAALTWHYDGITSCCVDDDDDMTFDSGDLSTSISIATTSRPNYTAATVSNTTDTNSAAVTICAQSPNAADNLLH